MSEQLLYESDTSRISRVAGPGGTTAIRKETLGPGAARRMRHEFGIAKRLAGSPGVPEVAAEAGIPEAILIEDTGGSSLAEVLAGRPMSVPELLAVAVELAGVVAAMHRRGVVHGDINPANILVVGTPPHPMLIDFGLATTFPEERPGFTHHNDVVGTPAYMAPEQTGRTGWPVDHRADLYGLGATLYELATGEPPFGAGDVLRLIHDHLTREPVPACDVNPAVSAALSAIIGHLLQKEPDRRYQSAEGVQHDLHVVAAAPGGRVPGFMPGRRDFPWRLAAPTRLVGREPEIGVLTGMFADVAAGRRAAVLVSGQPGVGKTVLIDQLRPVVTQASGWFLTGKFDQYRRETGSDAVQQMTRALARMLLAEPEAELAALRVRLRAALGVNAGLMVAAVPALEPVLGVPQEAPDDPSHAPIRLLQAGLDLLGAVASADRPTVVVFDDLQWADPASVDFIDVLLTTERLDHVLVVGAYRESEVDAAHPLAPMLQRWCGLDGGPRLLRLGNLSSGDLEHLLADILRMPAAETTGLAAAIKARTDGNPFDTVQLVNALRRDGVLLLDDDGWSWDDAALARDAGPGDVVQLLAARICALGAPAHEALLALTCLGGDAEMDLLRMVFDGTAAHGRAAGEPAVGSADQVPELEERLAPAIEEGLLVMQHGRATSVRFRHDRVLQAAHSLMGERDRRSRHLGLARRFAAEPGCALVAAEQYLAAGEDPPEPLDPAECRQAAGLLRTAAGHARELGRHAQVDRCLAMAASLLRRLGPDTVTPADEELRRILDVERHAALNSLGRFDEVDALYDGIRRHNADPLQRGVAASAQVNSLLSRGRAPEALELGVTALAELGVPVPAAGELRHEIDRGLDMLAGWSVRGADDEDRPITIDATDEVIGRILHWAIAAAYFCVDPMMAWLVIESARLWDRDGPDRSLIGPMAHVAFAAALREDYATGHAGLRRVVRAAERRGYEPHTSQARFLYALSAGPWFEPIEDTLRQARLAREGLIRGGDLADACFTYFATTPQLLDAAPTVDDLLDDVEEGLDFTGRINPLLVDALVAYREAARTLIGGTDESGGPDDGGFDEDAHLAAVAANPNAAANYHMARGVTAAVFGETEALNRHSAALVPLLPFVLATQCVMTAHVLQGLSAAARLRAAPPAEHAATLAELDGCRDWLARRAEEAPANFLHLRLLVDAERAWALGELDSALDAFEQARHQAARLWRPWQRGLIIEHLGLFHLARGAEEAGRAALREARDLYLDWGAYGKVARLDHDHPFLAGADDGWAGAEARRRIDARRSGNIPSETVDLLAVLRASQALSSETSLHRLRDRVREVLGTLTGATSAHVVLRQDGGWVLPLPGSAAGGDHGAIPVAEAADRGLLPLSVFHYAERTHRPLTVDDAARDDRFCRDPYLRDVRECSLMAVPIDIRGESRAMLLLENRHSRGAFAAGRLDAVLLIAGQLSVSLENALLYADLERKVAERTEELREANERLELLAVTDPLTGLSNRRRLTEVLEAEWRRAHRSRVPITVAMIDIDHFKRYNDEYGHPAGDECLRRIAAAIRRSVRDTDTCARYGGEEFALVLPGADPAAAAKVAERVRAAVAELGEPNPRADHQRVTVSVGIATTVPGGFRRAEQLIKAADAGLYEAKRRGRDQVRVGDF